MGPQPNLQWPDCGSTKFFRNGHDTSDFGVKIQRYLCRSCGRRFSDPDDLIKAKQVADSYLPYNTDINNLNFKGADNKNSQVCVVPQDAKNLAPETFENISVSQEEKRLVMQETNCTIAKYPISYPFHARLKCK